jgi:hypothetical protein
MNAILVTLLLIGDFAFTLRQSVDAEQVRREYRPALDALFVLLRNTELKGTYTISTVSPAQRSSRKYAFDIAVGSGFSHQEMVPNKARFLVTWLPDDVPRHSWFQRILLRNNDRLFEIRRSDPDGPWAVEHAGPDWKRMIGRDITRPLALFWGFGLSSVPEILFSDRYQIDAVKSVTHEERACLQIDWSRRPKAPSAHRVNGVDIEFLRGWFILDPENHYALCSFAAEHAMGDHYSGSTRFKKSKDHPPSLLIPIQTVIETRTRIPQDDPNYPSGEYSSQTLIEYTSLKPSAWSDRDFSLEPYGLAALNQPPAQSTFNPFTWIFLAAALAFLALALWLRKRNARTRHDTFGGS